MHQRPKSVLLVMHCWSSLPSPRQRQVSMQIYSMNTNWLPTKAELPDCSPSAEIFKLVKSFDGAEKRINYRCWKCEATQQREPGTQCCRWTTRHDDSGPLPIDVVWPAEHLISDGWPESHRPQGHILHSTVLCFLSTPAHQRAVGGVLRLFWSEFWSGNCVTGSGR